jgi:hypothetical protein
VAAELNPLMPGGEHRTKDTEGVSLRVKGDGKGYACVLTNEDGFRWGAGQARRAWQAAGARGQAAGRLGQRSAARGRASTVADGGVLASRAAERCSLRRAPLRPASPLTTPPPLPCRRYITRFPTRMGYLTLRLPYTTFRPEAEGQPPLDPASIRGVALRYENRRSPGGSGELALGEAGGGRGVCAGGRGRAAWMLDGHLAWPADGVKGCAPQAGPAAARGRRSAAAVPAGARPPALCPCPADPRPCLRPAHAGRADEQQFNLEVDWIKALPGGVEPDFVLVSCAGVARPGDDAEEVSKVGWAQGGPRGGRGRRGRQQQGRGGAGEGQGRGGAAGIALAPAECAPAACTPQVTGYKRRGEDHLRQSGLGYAVIRPGGCRAQAAAGAWAHRKPV